MMIDVDTISERCIVCPEFKIATESFWSEEEVVFRRFYCEHLKVCSNIYSFREKKIGDKG